MILNRAVETAKYPKGKRVGSERRLTHQLSGSSSPTPDDIEAVRQHIFDAAAHAPNLSNIFALACISRIRYLASNTPSEPLLAPVSVNRSSLSEPE